MTMTLTKSHLWDWRTVKCQQLIVVLKRSPSVIKALMTTLPKTDHEYHCYVLMF